MSMRDEEEVYKSDNEDEENNEKFYGDKEYEDD